MNHNAQIIFRALRWSTGYFYFGKGIGLAEPMSEKLVGTIGIRVSETTDRELDSLVEKLEDVNSIADTLVKKALTLDITTDAINIRLWCAQFLSL